MKTIRNILVALVVILALLLVAAFFLPAWKHVEGSTLIKAPAYVVFNNVNNFANWKKWSPWAARDSQMVSTYEGPASGIGAISKWTSPDKKTGNGSMRIIQSNPYKNIQIELVMMKQDTSMSPWTFSESNEGTTVTWGLDMAKMNLMERYFALFMQKIMDPYFKQGLDNLKAVSERLAAQYPGNMGVIEVKEIQSMPAISIIDSATMPEMNKKMAALFGELMAYTTLKKLEIAAPSYCLYHTWNPAGYTRFETGVPLKISAAGKGRIKAIQTPSGKATTVFFQGPYSSLVQPYELIDQYIKDNNLTITGGPWEVYIMYPKSEPDSMKWQTRIYFPVK
jgi:effector-binding domain-containing protein